MLRQSLNSKWRLLVAMQWGEWEAVFSAPMLGAEETGGEEMEGPGWWMREGPWRNWRNPRSFRVSKNKSRPEMLIKLWTWSLPIFPNYKIFQRFSEKCFNKCWHFANIWVTLNRKQFLKSLLNSLPYSSPSAHSRSKICSRVDTCPFHS